MIHIDELYALIDEEIDAQDDMWGPQNGMPNERWMEFLIKNVDELDRYATRASEEVVRAKVVHIMAILSRWQSDG